MAQKSLLPMATDTLRCHGGWKSIPLSMLEPTDTGRTVGQRTEAAHSSIGCPFRRHRRNDMEWQPIGRDIHALVNSDGKIVAKVNGTMVYGVYIYAGDEYISLGKAKAAAERAHLPPVIMARQSPLKTTP